MYEVIKNVIDSGRYALEPMLTKIDTLWVQGGITDAQRQELTALARSYALPENTYAPLQTQIDALAARVAALEGEKPSEDWPLFRQPTGAHDAYHTGDKVTFSGKRYVCAAPEGVAVVWSPEVYPSYWEEQA